MNPLILQGIGLVLSTISELLPLLLGSANANTAAQVDRIIALLQQWLPLVGSEITVLYSGIKNIITALTADPSTTAAQFAALQQLDASADAAFEAAAADVDPDAPGAPTA